MDFLTPAAAGLGAMLGAWLAGRRPRPVAPPARRATRPPDHDAVALSDVELAALEEDGTPDDGEPVDGRTYAG